ncbi:protein phosphatase methylesterase 1-like isoform X2 [Xenia sp. Carnegie-2017]|uniref:protein phosphatase methylesterase 1-like isoform X2 n=1 Tax=Xenia sp. Carnegie-2017 TaxID=2897299 RepID=UPI001F03E2B7|nr:protein phosphatase methylesterase 1-like isoform X2 [Xenia sp. Carnegie-2017]
MQRDLLRKRLPTGTPRSNDENSAILRRRRDYSQVGWENYFESYEDVIVGENCDTFRVYKCGSCDSGPVLFLIHGGGFSSLTWSVFAVKMTALSHCQVIAMDCRGHGDTHTSHDYDLSIETLTNDVQSVIETLYPRDPPAIILVGHSMGGAVVVHVVSQCLLPSVVAVVVVDVVEGTALEGLPVMQSFLKNRPKAFSSMEKAIEWSVRTGQIHNLESARVSMAGQLVKSKVDNSETSKACTTSDLFSISEDSKEERVVKQNNMTQFEYTWRINLSKTEKYWQGWFNDLSSLFLSCSVPKLLLVAGRDRLDKELTLAHIQGCRNVSDFYGEAQICSN